MDKYLGKRLEGRYEIQELIGMGGMSNVYKAFDIIDQRTVAVKILRDEYLTNTEFLRRFKNESKAIAVLSHPNIVRVYDVSFTNHVHSIVMEYIDGITLKDYIERKKVINWKESLHFTLQILRALQHAHDKGIVHRDIKPQNIMLLQNGTIKVTDFGIARFARSEVQTITDRAIGSVHYISPEQAMGDNTDEKSDIYSVGVMLFEMLTGKLPFEADTAVSVAIKQIQTQAVRPTQINPAIPEGLEEITVRAMQKDASKRYQSASAMIADIEQFKQNPSIHFQYKYDMESKQAQDKKYRRAVQQSRDDDPNRKPRRRTPYIAMLTGVTFAFVLASVGFIALMVTLNNPFAQVEEIPVPDLVGMRFETAVTTYPDIEFVEVETVNNDEYGRGVIFEQNPRAGRRVRMGSTVEVKVSSGQARVEMLNFEGRETDQVYAKLDEWGLDYEEIRQYSETVPAGCVIYTNPSKGTEVRSGTTVQVYVSMGPEEPWTTVPSVIGMTVDSARIMLEAANLRVGDITYEESDEPADTIIAQDPGAGNMQQLEGTSVNLVISTGQDSDWGRVAIPVPLPPLDRTCTLQAYQDGALVYEEVLNPAEVGTWMPWFEGDSNSALVEIYIDGQLFRDYLLDIPAVEYTPGGDYTANFS